MIASIVVDYDTSLIDLFSCEDKTLSNNRASYTITTDEDKNVITFTISALDAVALRATLTSITKTLTVYEKMKELVEHDK